MIIEISVAVIALAFVVLVIYLTITLCAVQKVLQSTQEILQSTQEKVDALDGFFKAAELLGDKAKSAMEHIDESSLASEQGDQDNRSRSKNTMGELIEWLALGVTLWRNLKKRR